MATASLELHGSSMPGSESQGAQPQSFSVYFGCLCNCKLGSVKPERELHEGDSHKDRLDTLNKGFIQRGA